MPSRQPEALSLHSTPPPARSDAQPERGYRPDVLHNMIGNKMPPDQGRARGLYDEQLQRKQQEKALFRLAERTERGDLFQPHGHEAAGKA